MDHPLLREAHYSTDPGYITFWSVHAPRNTVLVYHEGYLCRDRYFNRIVDLAGDAAMKAWVNRRVRLFQLRIGPLKCLYLAVRR